MAKKPDISAYKTFEQISGRLDEIVGQVKSKDTSLERSLDLFDEAIALGSAAVDLVDTTDFSPAEEALLAQEGEATDEAKPKTEPASDAADSDAAEQKAS